MKLFPGSSAFKNTKSLPIMTFPQSQTAARRHIEASGFPFMMYSIHPRREYGFVLKSFLPIITLPATIPA
jgi:hypothetical protein